MLQYFLGYFSATLFLSRSGRSLPLVDRVTGAGYIRSKHPLSLQLAGSRPLVDQQ